MKQKSRKLDGRGGDAGKANERARQAGVNLTRRDRPSVTSSRSQLLPKPIPRRGSSLRLSVRYQPSEILIAQGGTGSPPVNEHSFRRIVPPLPGKASETALGAGNTGRIALADRLAQHIRRRGTVLHNPHYRRDAGDLDWTTIFHGIARDGRPTSSSMKHGRAGASAGNCSG